MDEKVKLEKSSEISRMFSKAVKNQANLKIAMENALRLSDDEAVKENEWLSEKTDRQKSLPKIIWMAARAIFLFHRKYGETSCKS